MAIAIPVTPGAARRLPVTCNHCGWADIWETRLYVLSEQHGPVQVGAIRDCARCVSAKRREAGHA